MPGCPEALHSSFWLPSHCRRCLARCARACDALIDAEAIEWELCALARTSGVTAAHDYAATHYANLLTVVGRLDDAAAQVADGTEQPRREGNAMAVDLWATIDEMVHHAVNSKDVNFDDTIRASVMDGTYNGTN